MGAAYGASSCGTGATTEEDESQNTDVDSAEDNDEGSNLVQVPSVDESDTESTDDPTPTGDRLLNTPLNQQRRESSSSEFHHKPRPAATQVLITADIHMSSDSGSSKPAATAEITRENMVAKNRAGDACSTQTPKRKYTVEDISPLPKRTLNPGSKRKTTSQATVLTGSPHKRSFKTASSKEKKVGKKAPSGKKRCCSNRSLVSPPPIVQLKLRLLGMRESTDEDWIQCRKCEEWAHEQCADLSDPQFYYCDNCDGPSI